MKQPKTMKICLLIWELFAFVMLLVFVKERFHPALYYELYEFDIGMCIFPLAVTKSGAWFTRVTGNEYLIMFCVFGFLIAFEAADFWIRKKQHKKYWIFVLILLVWLVIDLFARTVLFASGRYVYPSGYFYISLATSLVQIGLMAFYIISFYRRSVMQGGEHMFES